jgi:hypothetical protein
VDLNKRQVIDLLSDRSVESLQAWLERHPGGEVRRDRCGIYAEAPKGASKAVQVADRFHLFLNLSTAIERALEERSREPCLSDPAPEQQAVEVPLPSERRITLEGQRKQQRRQRRDERHQRVIELHRLGHKQLFEQVAVNCPIIRSMRFLDLDFREAIATQDTDGMLHLDSHRNAVPHRASGSIRVRVEEGLERGHRSGGIFLEKRPD